MSALVTGLFFVVLILFLCALGALVRPRWFNLKTRKEAAQSVGLFLVVLIILGAFLPDDEAPPETAQKPHIVLTEGLVSGGWGV